MYNLKFIRSDDVELVMNFASGIIISHVSGATGRITELETSRGFGLIGEIVDGSAVAGADITILGKILDGRSDVKRSLLRVLAPNSHGRLVWNNELEIEVYVTASPEIEQKRHSAFAVTFRAPFPYWRYCEEVTASFGALTPEFTFPVNYSTPHKFGTRSLISSLNVFSRGDFDADYDLTIIAGSSGLTDGRLTNIRTGEYIEFTGSIDSGDRLHVWRENGEIRAVKTLAGVESPAFDMIADESSLFTIHAGDNPLEWSATSGSTEADVSISFYAPTLEVLADGV